MLPSKYAPLIFAFFMSLFMAFIMSGLLTLVNLGPVPDFFGKWMRAFAVAWVLAFPIVFAVAPIVRRLTAALTGVPAPPNGNDDAPTP